MTTNTPNRGYTYPGSSDHDRLWEHFQELATDIDTDVAAILAAYLTPVKTTGTGVITAAANFTTNSAVARTLQNGKHVYIALAIQSNNALTASGGNIADTTIGTIVSGLRPTEITNAIFSANAGTGECRINPDGTVVIRTLDVNISAGGVLSITFNFIKD